ncbi:hypothetical protein HYV43_03625 [Candidatus Micrarchaeota archaeon]|nr:hypothetical protein [Candidatus Micrarchaeota archaeon]
MVEEQPGLRNNRPIPSYARNHRTLLRALRSRERQTVVQNIQRFLHDAEAHNETAHQLTRSILHALGERRLGEEKISTLESLLRMRPDISIWHLLGALKVEGKARAGRVQRVKTIRNLLRHDAFVRPLTVRAAMGAYYDQRVGPHVKAIFRQHKYLDHAETRRELAHNLAYMLSRHKESDRLVRPYVSELAGHDGFRQEMGKIIQAGRIEYVFGSRRAPKLRRIKLSSEELQRIRNALND